jgi:hypothetical protein
MPKPQTSTESLHERITKRAHEIYLQGSQQGALADWLQAEREILQQENPD